jgi:GNAT superfamily N-acetyltransferase
VRVLVRPAQPADYFAFAMLFGELSLDEPTPPASRWLGDLMRHTLVADDGAVCGYVNFERLGNAGHVRNLVVAPDARHRGVGLALMTAAADALRLAGASEWHLNVKAHNAAAIQLYEKLGMRAEHRSTIVQLAWANVPQVSAAVTAAAPEEDDDLERAFALPSGRIAMARRPGRIVRQLRDTDLSVLGFAVFDRELPGATLFRVTQPALAAPLLAALRADARHDYLQVVVENHDALADALIAAGGMVRLRLLHYSGPLTTAASRCA